MTAAREGSNFCVELLHQAVDDLIRALSFVQAFTDKLQALVFIRFIDFSRVILLVAIVLYLFTFVLDFGKT